MVEPSRVVTRTSPSGRHHTRMEMVSPMDPSGGPIFAVSFSTVTVSSRHGQHHESGIARVFVHAIAGLGERSATGEDSEQPGFHVGHLLNVKLMKERWVSPGLRILLGKLP